MSEPLVSEAYAPTLVSAIPETAVVRAVDRSQVTVSSAAPAPLRKARRGAALDAVPKPDDESQGEVGLLETVGPLETVAPRETGAPQEKGAPQKKGAPDTAKPSRKRHLHVVGENSRLRPAPEHRTRWLLGVAGAFAVAIAFGLVYLHVIAAQRQLPLDRLNNEVIAQEASYQRLRLEVAELNSPSRIIPYAETKLGMTEPTSPVYVNPSGPSSATPSTTDPSQAPAGDADWPQIKNLIAGTP